MLRVLYTIITLLIGLFLIYLGFARLTSDDIENIRSSFANIHYFYLIVAFVLGVFSHWARSHRWKYLLKPMGYESSEGERFNILMVSYLINLGVPRLGEVARSAMLSKRNQFSTSRVFGTIITERFIDLAILLVLTILVFIVEFSIVNAIYLKFQKNIMQKYNLAVNLLYVLPFLILVAGALYWFFRASKIVSFFTNKIKLAYEGIVVVFNMEHSIFFILDTFVIWVFYVAMFYFTFLSIPDLSAVSFWAALTTYVIATYSILFIQGGIGVYPIMVMIVLGFYGVSDYLGYAIGWVFWTLQIFVILLLSLISILFLYAKNEPSN